MRLKSLQIEHFRSCENVRVDFDPHTCLVGPNGAGKSTVLAALNVLFRHASGSATDVAVLSDEDFCAKDTSRPVRITGTFHELSDAAQADLTEYVRHGELVITAKATWIAASRTAEVKQYGSRLVMRAFAPFFEQDKAGSKVGELRDTYNGLRKRFAELPAASAKGDLIAALRAYEEVHRDDCELAESEDEFYGVSRGANRLAPHIQWVYVPAVKDAANEQTESRDSTLGQLLQRTIRSQVDFNGPLAELRDDALARYQKIVDDLNPALQTIEQQLQTTLRQWSHPGANVELRWNTESDKNLSVNAPFAKIKVGEGQFLGDVARLGHGMQRGFIVAMLHQLAGSGREGPTLLLGFEEPELYQHPPQARHLAGVLEALSSGNAQVIITTHSPFFVSGRGFQSVRLVRKNQTSGHSTCAHATFDAVSERLATALGTQPDPAVVQEASLEQIFQPSQKEVFFCSVPILVEGVEDVAYLATYFELTGRLDDFRRLGCHFVVVEGKNKMSRPLAVADLLGLKAFVICDGDADCSDKDRNNHSRDNNCLLRLAGMMPVGVLTETVWGDRLIMWRTSVGKVVREEAGGVWERATETVMKEAGYRNAMGGKNSSFIGAMLHEVWRNGTRVPSLERAVEGILKFAEAEH